MYSITLFLFKKLIFSIIAPNEHISAPCVEDNKNTLSLFFVTISEIKAILCKQDTINTFKHHNLFLTKFMGFTGVGSIFEIIAL